MKIKHIQMSDLVCTECGEVMKIPRKEIRETHHIKDMYCYRCKKETKFIEVRDVEQFKKKIEFADYISEKDQFIYDLLCKNEEINFKR